MPKPELQRPDGDLELMFLSGNGVHFDKKMADEWYRATVPSTKAQISTLKDPIDLYDFETAASPMGCVRQWQWCNPSLPPDRACGPLASYYDAYVGAAPLFGITAEEMGRDRPSAADPRGSAVNWADMILRSNPQQLNDFVLYARSGALASKGLVFSAVALGLPDDQWKRDVVKWWNMVMATWQMAYVSVVRGPNEPEFAGLRSYPVNDMETRFCENQVSLSPLDVEISVRPHMWSNAYLLMHCPRKS